METYKGNEVDEGNFNRLKNIAETQISKYTFNRADYVEDERILNLIERTIYSLIDEQSRYEQSYSADGIKSKSIGKKSVTYSDKSDVGGEGELRSIQYNIIYDNLIHTGLMYRGFY